MIQINPPSGPYFEGVVNDLQRALWGRATCTVTEAANITSYSQDALKNAIALGQLTCSRTGKGSRCKIVLTIRSLAVWIVTNERNSIPEPQPEPDLKRA